MSKTIYFVALMLLCASIASAQETTSGCNQHLILSSIQNKTITPTTYRLCSGEAYKAIQLTIEKFTSKTEVQLLIQSDINGQTSNNQILSSKSLQKSHAPIIVSELRCLKINTPTSGDWVLEINTTCVDIPQEKLKIIPATSAKTTIHKN
jgi:hypothetical protein